MGVNVLAVNDEVDVADLFRQPCREVQQGRRVLHFACSAGVLRIGPGLGEQES
jgi:hypothetical protein